jgi:hypothetical protein
MAFDRLLGLDARQLHPTMLPNWSSPVKLRNPVGATDEAETMNRQET